VRLDCDGDVIILRVHQVGGIACHTGRESCFYRVYRDNRWEIVDPVLTHNPDTEHSISAHQQPFNQHVLQELTQILEERKIHGDPNSSYVAKLHHAGLDKILQKLGEEATETILAAKNVQHTQDKAALIYETADMWFHSLVALSHLGENADSVLTELARRFNLSGITEKAMRSTKS
jgi:phosphoribosyl-AMP cyclohydrolase / phosphoribosyl-ATP pyrophosphohydrolase